MSDDRSGGLTDEQRAANIALEKELTAAAQKRAQEAAIGPPTEATEDATPSWKVNLEKKAEPTAPAEAPFAKPIERPRRRGFFERLWRMILRTTATKYNQRKDALKRSFALRSLRYQLSDNDCTVTAPPERYSRPNAVNTLWFEGTRLYLREFGGTRTMNTDYLGIYDFARQGDRVATMMCPYTVGPFSHKLAIAVINRRTGVYTEVPENMEKCASKKLGGVKRLRKDMLRYAVVAMKPPPPLQ